MTKLLGVDVGTKKVGLALSDEGAMMAFPFVSVEADGAFGEIIGVCEEKGIREVVLGESLSSGGESNEIMIEVEALKDMLEDEGITVHLEGEAFTSRHARDLTGKKGRVDETAAALILQRFLDRRKDS